jgi:hypothetical protein
MKLPSFSSLVGIILLLIAIITGVGFYFARQYSKIGAGYAAKQLCSCIYVQQRDETACLSDVKRALGKPFDRAKIIYFSERVVVDFGGFGQAQANLTPGFGCSAKSFSGALPNALNNPNQE